MPYSGDTTAIGSVTLTLKGKGNFTGERTLSYKIVDADQILVSKLSVTKPKDMEYTGEPLMPDLIVKNGKAILVKDQNYTLEYLDNIDIGTATIIIRGMNAYSGVKMINFRIVGVPLSKAKIDKTSLPSSLKSFLDSDSLFSLHISMHIFNFLSNSVLSSYVSSCK